MTDNLELLYQYMDFSLSSSLWFCAVNRFSSNAVWNAACQCLELHPLPDSLSRLRGSFLMFYSMTQPTEVYSTISECSWHINMWNWMGIYGWQKCRRDDGIFGCQLSVLIRFSWTEQGQRVTMKKQQRWSVMHWPQFPLPVPWCCSEKGR